jgi:hypothetical protein
MALSTLEGLLAREVRRFNALCRESKGFAIFIRAADVVLVRALQKLGSHSVYYKIQIFFV